jgi:hypothetical protein
LTLVGQVSPSWGARLFVDSGSAFAVESGSEAASGFFGPMRLFTRFIGLILLALAFAAAVVDAAHYVAVGAWEPLSMGAALYRVSPHTLAALQGFVESKLGLWAWNNVFVRALLTPAFLALAIVSALLFLLSRPSAPLIGQSSRDR